MKIPKAVTFVCGVVADFSPQAEARVVGGYVRDALYDRTPKEIDMATNVCPRDIMKLFEAKRVKVIPTGIDHGTITLLINNNLLEITTLRFDVKCDGRHAEVIFGKSWEEDAKRRDFTINAMYADCYGKVYDYFHGRNDLNAKIVRFIGDPERRIHEDCLRILRYFRFLGYFDYSNGITLDRESFDASVKLSGSLKGLSAERIKGEVMKLLTSTSQQVPVQFMAEKGIFDQIGLKLHLDSLQVKNLFFHRDPIINLSALLKISNLYDPEPLKLLKFSNKEQKIIHKLINSDFEKIFDCTMGKFLKGEDVLDEIHRAMQEFGKEDYIMLFQVYFVMKAKAFIPEKLSDQLESFERTLSGIKMQDFPISGVDIIGLGFKKQDIGEQLKLAKDLWLDSNCKASKATILRLLQEKSFY